MNIAMQPQNLTEKELTCLRWAVVFGGEDEGARSRSDLLIVMTDEAPMNKAPGFRNQNLKWEMVRAMQNV
ncbi:hypothetical protein RJT34_05256 [Clitoria ternatea]|uniref:Uncharacterized protein n=1 Tax=Clitoria ternatea TaxID=43366 RepID=A0AAN9K3H3_CLITE